MPARPTPPSRPPHAHVKPRPLDEHELDELQALLDAVPAPLEALDVGMLDGFLCGVLVQPVRPPASRWLPHVSDAEGRKLPASFDATRLHELVLRRHAELDDAIARRQWFDPWVFEGPGEDSEDEEDAPPEVEAVYPWVAGFATAMEVFPVLIDGEHQDEITEPLALVFRHLDPDDLEDADALLAEIESLEPPQDLAEAVEGLVRATLLLADVSRPQPVAKKAGPAKPPPRRPPPRRR